MIDIKHLSKGAVVAALYNASRPLGMGFLHFDAAPMTAEEGEAHFKECSDFDYLKGRVMKVNLKGDSFDPWGYDRDNGQGSAQKVIQSLTNTGNPNSDRIQQAQKTGTIESAKITRKALSEETESQWDGRVGIVKIGLADMAETLGPKINEAIGHINQ